MENDSYLASTVVKQRTRRPRGQTKSFGLLKMHGGDAWHGKGAWHACALSSSSLEGNIGYNVVHPIVVPLHACSSLQIQVTVACNHVDYRSRLVLTLLVLTSHTCTPSHPRG